MSNEKVDDLSIYEALPQQKAQGESVVKPQAKLDYTDSTSAVEKQNVFTERGRKASIAPKVVEQSDLLTSLDEGYPPEFQPRDRSRAASKAQVSEIANRLNPEFLGDSPKASDGRPLVAPVTMPDGATKYAVISGNGRTAGIREAYNLDNDGAKSYKEFASSKGGKDLNQPVYVGVMNPNEVDDFSEFAKESNESATAQMSASEQAKSDADRLDASVLNLFVPSEDGTIHGAANRDFVRSFLDRTTSTSERSRYIDADGKLSQEGVTKVKNAIFAKAFGNSEMGTATLQRMAESTDSNIKNITNALLAKAGELSSFAEAAKDNRRFKDADIAPDFSRAMEKYSELKESGTSLDEYIRQGALFGADTSPLQTRVMQVFDHYKRRSKSIRGIIDNYIKAAEALGDPKQQGLFGASEIPSKESIFEGAVKDYEKYDTGEETEQVGLFNANQRRENKSGSRSKSDAAIGETAPAGESAGTGQNRVEQEDAPFYSKAAAQTEFEQRRRNALARDLNRAIAADLTLPVLKDAKIDPSGKLNEAATVVLTHAKINAFGENAAKSAWYGVFLNPQHTAQVRTGLADIFKGTSNPVTAILGKRLLRQFDAAVKDNGSVTLITSSRNAPDGLKSARQEEAAHEFDYFEGGKHDVSIRAIFNDAVGNLAMRNLQKEGSAYRTAPPAALAAEVAAKIWVDGNNELGLTSEQIEHLQKVIGNKWLDAGASEDQLLNFLDSVSEKGKKYVEQVRSDKEGNSGNSQRVNAGRTGENEEADSGNSRRTESEQRPAPRFADRADGQNRQNQDLERSQTSNDLLYARPSTTRKALDLIDRAFDKSDNLSSIRAVESVFNKNLQQLKEADEDAFEQVMKFAGTQAQITVSALTGNQISQNFAQALYDKNLADVAVSLDLAGLAVPLGTAPTPTVVAGKPASVIRIGNKSYAVPNWLAKELKPVFEKSDVNGIQKVMRKLNAFGMAGPLDAVFHTANVVGTVIGATPYAGTDILSRTIGNTPATKWLATVVNLALINPETIDPQILRDMAEAGVIPNRYGRETYSKRLAAQLAAHRSILTMGPMLSGPKGIDIRARIAMWKIGKHINPNASNAELADFVNQLGIYNKALESQLSRNLKRSEIAPFFTAGSTMLKNGALMWLNKTPLPTGDLPFTRRASFRIQQQLGAGVLGVVAMWVAASLLYRGLLPWKDEDSRFLQIPLNDDDRQTGFAKQIFGDNDKTAYVGLGFLSPLLERGARGLGISGAYDTAILGGSGQQMFEAGAKDALNSMAHPVFTGPLSHAAFGVSGYDPQIKGMRDKSGDFGFSLWKKDLPKGAGFGTALTDSALELNPMVGSILHGLGVNRDEKDPEEISQGEANVYFRTTLDMAFLRLLKGPVDRDNARRRIAAERDAMGDGATAPGKDKKLDDAVRKGKMSADEATEILTRDVENGDISPAQYKQRIAALSQSKSVKAMTDADAGKDEDFTHIEKILKNAAPEDKPMLEKVLIDKVKSKFNSKTNKGIADGQKLLEIHDKYFAPE